MRAALGLVALLVLGACHRAGTEYPDARAPQALTYAEPQPRYALGLPIIANVPVWQGQVDRFSVRPELPAGLSLDPATGVLSGLPLELRARTIYEVGAENEFGRATAALALEVVAPRDRLWFVAGRDDDALTTLLPGDDGRLQLLYSATTTAAGATAVAAHPNGGFVYVTNRLQQTLTTLRVDAVSGSTERRGRMTLSSPPRGVVVDPVGAFVYVLADSVQRLRLDPGSGLPSAPFEVFAGADALTFAADGRRAYLVRDAERALDVVAVDAADGGFAKLGSLTGVFVRARPLVLHPSGRFAYLTDWGVGGVVSFAIDADSGLLARRSFTATGLQPSAVVVHPAGTLAYLLAAGSLRVELARIRADGGFEVVDTLPLTDVASGIELAADGASLYLSFGDQGRIVRYRVDGGGALRAPEVVQLRAPIGAVARVRARDGLRRLARHAYVACRDADRLLVHTLRDDAGELTRVDELVTGRAPWAVAVHPTGRAVYVAEYLDNTVREFRVDDAGNHTGAPPPDRAEAEPLAGVGPVDLAIDGAGRRLFVAFFGSDALGVFDASLGEDGLRPLDSVPVGAGPRALAMTPDGRFALVLSETAAELAVYDAATLALVARAGVAAEPQDVVVHPNGRHVYVSSRAKGKVVLLPLDPVSGALGAAIDGADLRSAGALALTADGAHLLVVGEEGELVAFEVVAPSGGLRETARAAISRGLLRVGLDPSARYALVADPARAVVETFGFDAASGTLRRLGESETLPGPAAVATSGRLAPR